MTEKFETFKDFQKKYELSDVCLAVCVVPPDIEGDYWLVQVALPMKNICVDCEIKTAKPGEITKYKKESLAAFKRSVVVKDEKMD